MSGRAKTFDLYRIPLNKTSVSFSLRDVQVDQFDYKQMPLDSGDISWYLKATI